MLSTGEVGRALRVAPATVKRWCEQGLVEGAFRTPGGHWRIPRAALDAIMGVDGVQRSSHQPG